MCSSSIDSTPRCAATKPAGACGFDESLNRRCFLDVMSQFGFQDSYYLCYRDGACSIGLPRDEVFRRVAAAPFLLNVMGYFNDEEILARAAHRVFLDIDPGFSQMWRELGLHDAFAGYDDFVTLGRNIGRPECTIPTCGLKWITMPQPVVLDEWPVVAGGAQFTSIGAWRGPNGPLEFGGKTYGLRVHEFRKFIELPRRCSAAFEMALHIHPAEVNDLELLRSHGWSLVDPQQVAGSAALYRQYIGQSKAELMIPKQMYVETHSGLLSDRSAYYLASGKPVLARDTGLASWYRTGAGLLTFQTLEEAISGVAEIENNYVAHSRAARALAEEYFESDRVLRQLLSDLEAVK